MCVCAALRSGVAFLPHWSAVSALGSDPSLLFVFLPSILTLLLTSLTRPVLSPPPPPCLPRLRGSSSPQQLKRSIEAFSLHLHHTRADLTPRPSQSVCVCVCVRVCLDLSLLFTGTNDTKLLFAVVSTSIS